MLDESTKFESFDRICKLFGDLYDSNENNKKLWDTLLDSKTMAAAINNVKEQIKKLCDECNNWDGEILALIFGLGNKEDPKKILKNYIAAHYVYCHLEYQEGSSFIKLNNQSNYLNIIKTLCDINENQTLADSNSNLFLITKSLQNNIGGGFRTTNANAYLQSDKIKQFLIFPLIFGIMKMFKIFDDSEIKKECLNRMYEGIFINESLSQFKDNISYIVNKIQRKNEQNEIPPHDRKCSSIHCNVLGKNCFNSNDHFLDFEKRLDINSDNYINKMFVKKEISELPIILDTINNKVCGDTKTCMGDMVFCIFLVVNFSADRIYK